MKGNCVPHPRGVLSTATIATVSIGGAKTPVDFVGGGDANLYTLNANTGAIIWHIALGGANSFLYSSSAIFNQSMYIGVASLSNCPLVQGKLFQVNTASGAIQHTFDVVPMQRKSKIISHQVPGMARPCMPRLPLPRSTGRAATAACEP